MAIKILDKNKNPIGELMTATTDEMMQYIKKGLVVVDTCTGEEVTEASLLNTIGCSDDCVIELGK